MTIRRVHIAVAALTAAWAGLVARYAFLCDDAFITYRYSRNWAEGHGPVYNLGENPPVEGYSDFLWMAIAALVHRLGGDMLVAMPVISVATGLGTLLLVVRVLAVDLPREIPGLPSVDAATVGATALVALSPPFAVWSTSGLETMPQTFLMVLLWWLLALRPDTRGGAWLAGLVGLALALIRTEGVAWVVVLLAAAAVARRAGGRDPVRPLLPVVLVTGAGFAAFLAWRLDFYGQWVANTAYAKVHLGPAALARGIHYVAQFGATLVAPVPLLVIAASGWSSPTRRVGAAALALALAVLGYAVAVSGDYMAWFRILVPAVPFLAIAVGAAVASWDRTPAVLVPLVLAAVGLLPAYEIHLAPRPVREALDVRDKLDGFRTENTQWSVMNGHVRAWTARGRALKAYAEPHWKVVAGAIGCLGYYSDLFVLDRNGLVTAEVGRAPWDGELRSPGHDKNVEPAFFLPWEPEILDAKVIDGPKAAEKIARTLGEMDATRYRRNYFPHLVEVDTTRKVRRFLLVLRRGADPDDIASGWTRYEDDLAALRDAAGREEKDTPEEGEAVEDDG